MFKKILIANRGEIACRIIRTARQMGVKTVAVYSDADANAQHVQMADESVRLGGTTAAESYLIKDKIIAAAKQTGAEAIHPGYGFLSENADFADLCVKSGLVFIGPPASAIRAMGSKSAAKALMQKAKVPVVPGYHGEDQDIKTFKKEAAKIGYPVLLKATAGGGGKGMRIVESEADLESAVAGAQREAQSSFGDPKLLVEKYLVRPRHIEIQVFADNFGNTVYLFERDCSIQRRHQKVVEEAPAPHMPEKTRTSMGKAAVDAACAVNYSGAGTVEFIMGEDGNFYFMEMNTRLQVEHPVTEMITGKDLVEWQLRVASGEKLGFDQKDLSINGHAIEVRLYAEDADKDFLPATGTLRHLEFPSASRHVRCDTGVVTGDTITPFYDPMIAKLITWGETRGQAIAQMQHLLRDVKIAGLVTNLGFLRTIMAHSAFGKGEVSTDFIAKHRANLFYKPTGELADVTMALACLYRMREFSCGTIPMGWRLSGGGESYFYFEAGEAPTTVKCEFSGDICRFHIDGRVFEIAHTEFCDDGVCFTLNGHKTEAVVVTQNDDYWIMYNGDTGHCKFHRFAEAADHRGHAGGLQSPMPGKVVQVLVSANQNVERGQPLLILEAMKMEHTIKAPSGGKVKEIFYKVGEQVSEGVELLAIEAAS
ncbi:MAG: acetyl/propionyl/methylcrotonyl-CoA carboxylase subunit alpha [Alphaproteobacteria bacterium]|nr:MAG: acetyl/propionyl/methylcrotonyl-CoA carboxylase subunit alpha [Alphaproteobacteria bacterium]